MKLFLSHFQHTPTEISISPQSTGLELEKLIQDKLNLHDQNLKMICSGRMIQLNEQLQKQNIRVSQSYPSINLTYTIFVLA